MENEELIKLVTEKAINGLLLHMMQKLRLK